jgi:hypothetical protein
MTITSTCHSMMPLRSLIERRGAEVLREHELGTVAPGATVELAPPSYTERRVVTATAAASPSAVAP